MSRVGTTDPVSGSAQKVTSWQQLPALARAFALGDRLLTQESQARADQPLAPLPKALALAELAHRLTSASRCGLTGAELDALSRAWWDRRISQRSCAQRTALLFVTGAALGLRGIAPSEAERLLAGALELARLTSAGSDWAPFEGPRPLVLPRHRPFLRPWPDAEGPNAPDAGHGVDPSGDPQEIPMRTSAESLPGGLVQPVPVSQILDGLDLWQAVLQTHLGWPEGDMAALGRPNLEAWGLPFWLEHLGPDEATCTFMHALAGAARAA